MLQAFICAEVTVRIYILLGMVNVKIMSQCDSGFACLNVFTFVLGSHRVRLAAGVRRSKPENKVMVSLPRQRPNLNQA